ncbi:hypothetical protein [Altererythrobacter sp. ZODW24]|uniref:hypothetical protein n=1 Tax=Altererythrobacter sp. ZODW24 TaxID=2185142 RepID=UPI001F088064|nr:hypothetical protein [Altererythrobacter sp. ZODW24]
MKHLTILAAAGLLVSCAEATEEPMAAVPPVSGAAEAGPRPALLPTTRKPASPPLILDQTKATMLRENTGITLQWIDWDERGQVKVTVKENGVWLLSGVQTGSGPGTVILNGVVTEIGSDYFLLDGLVSIVDTPDIGRGCSDRKVWRFGITQGRQYWRLREFEWCDGLTDYIDIYF